MPERKEMVTKDRRENARCLPKGPGGKEQIYKKPVGENRRGTLPHGKEKENNGMESKILKRERKEGREDRCQGKIGKDEGQEKERKGGEMQR